MHGVGCKDLPQSFGVAGTISLRFCVSGAELSALVIPLASQTMALIFQRPCACSWKSGKAGSDFLGGCISHLEILSNQHVAKLLNVLPLLMNHRTH